MNDVKPERWGVSVPRAGHWEIGMQSGEGMTLWK
jgi:hypothetical protein